MKTHPPRVAKKRGAIELSMTTIVVVVIGITILTLGLRWIFNIFGGLESQRQKLIEATEEQIRETFGDSSDPINLLTSSILIKQGDFYDLSVGVKNTYGERHNFVYNVQAVDVPSNVNPNTAISWLKWDRTTIGLNSGQLYVDTVSIDPTNAPLGIYRYKITLECTDCGQTETSSVSFTMRVQ